MFNQDGFGLIRGEEPLVTAWEIAALDRGETVTIVGQFREVISGEKTSFRTRFLELSPNGLVLVRRVLLIVVSRTPVPGRIISAQVRPYKSRREAFSFAATGMNAPGAPREWEAFTIIACETTAGPIEIGINKRHVRTIVHYARLQSKRKQQ
jgi:hypothetical protein